MSRNTSSIRGGIILSVLALLLLGLTGNTSARLQQNTESNALQAAFNAAIYDAAVYRHSNLRKLRPLTFNKNGQALVATLTARDYKRGPVRLNNYVWVTGVPEVQEICRGFTDDLALQLRQLLGLQPDSKITHFVTMLVRRRNVFRPATDPNTTTEWPCPDPDDPGCGESFPKQVSPAHIIWIANQTLSSYIVSEVDRLEGYPWTHLGYTYNWRRGADRYGSSEYVIRKGATVTVTDISPFVEYCKAGH